MKKVFMVIFIGLVLISLLVPISMPVMAADGQNIKYESYAASQGNTNADVYSAQTFTPKATHIIKYFNFYITNRGQANGSIIASVRAVDADGQPTGPNLASSTTIPANNIPVGTNIVSFDLGTGCLLMTGTKYALQIIYNEGDDDLQNSNLWFVQDTNGTYPDGQYCLGENGIDWNISNPTHDIWFEEWGIPALAVTVDQDKNQPDPAYDLPIKFSVTFSAPVSDFKNTDVATSGTAGGAKTIGVTGSGTTYTVAIGGLTSNGTVRISIPAGVAHDANGVANVASINKDYTVTYAGIDRQMRYEYYTATQGSSELARYAVQTFTPQSSHIIRSFKMLLVGNGQATGNLVGSIRAVDVFGQPAGPDLVKSLPVAASTVKTQWTTVTFNLEQDYTLQGGTKYALLLTSNGVGLWGMVDTGGTYAGGQYALSTDGIDWNMGNPNRDFWFEIWGPLQSQTITFAPLSEKIYGVNPFTISATASSGLPVTFAVLSGPASINGNLVKIEGVGTVTIRASQSGNDSYKPAENVDQSFIVKKGTPIFSSLISPTVYSGQSPVVISGVIKCGSVIPPGKVDVTLNGVTQSADINSTTGAFSSSFVTSTLEIAKSPYTINLLYTGNNNFEQITSSTQKLTIVSGSGGGGSSVGGGGGGGSSAGGGGAPPPPPPTELTISLTGFKSSSSVVTDNNGVTKANIQLKAENDKIVLDIAKGTSLNDAQGGVLKVISENMISNPPSPPDNYTVVTSYMFGPEGAKFNPAITMTLKYDPVQLPSGADETKVKIAYWNGSTWQILESMVDTTAKTVSAKPTHFSQYGILAAIPPPPPPEPAKFMVSNLEISSSEVNPGATFDVRALVKNSGGSKGTGEIILKINGNNVEKKQVNLNPGNVETVMFSTSINSPGKYTVDINGTSGQITVISPPPSPIPSVVTPLAQETTSAPVITTPAPSTAVPETLRQDKSNMPLNWIILGAVVVIGLIVGSILYLRRSKKPSTK